MAPLSVAHTSNPVAFIHRSTISISTLASAAARVLGIEDNLHGCCAASRGQGTWQACTGVEMEIE